MLNGIDVSNNNGYVNWNTTKLADLDFAVCKVTEGDYFFDQYAQQNWAGAAVAGLLRGVYHFAHIGDPIAEAKYFCSHVQQIGGLKMGDVVALDIEENPQNIDLSSWALLWLKTTQAILGVKPWVYTYYSFVGEFLKSQKALGDYPLWVADLTASVPSAPAPWTLVSAWQHSWTGRVSGVTGAVDLDVFFGTHEQFMKLGKSPHEVVLLVTTGLKRNAAHGGPNVLTLKANTKVLDSGERRNGFARVLSGDTWGWLDATHIKD